VRWVRGGGGGGKGGGGGGGGGCLIKKRIRVCGLCLVLKVPLFL